MCDFGTARKVPTRTSVTDICKKNLAKKEATTEFKSSPYEHDEGTLTEPHINLFTSEMRRQPKTTSFYVE